MYFNIIIALIFVSCWVVFYVMLINYIKPKKNIIIGVTLPHNAHNDPETLKICKSFKIWLNIVMIPLLLLAIPPLFLKLMGITMLWFMTWLLIAIVVPMIVFAKHRSVLLALKREKKWFSEAAGRSFADVKAASVMDSSPQKSTKKINTLLFLPPVFIGLASIVLTIIYKLETGFIVGAIVYTLFIIMIWLLYYLIFHVRTEVVNEDAALTVALTGMRRHNWGRFFLIASWLTAALIVVTWFFAERMIEISIITVCYAILMIGIALWTEFATRIAQQKLTAKDTGNFYLDEDEYWLLGIFYYNPNDNHFFVNDRVGMNMSMNLAKPAGKVVMILVALMIAALPFFGIWMWSEEVTPIELVINQNELKVRHKSDKYIINMNTIESAELIEELPPMIRTMGTALENLFKGNFRAGHYGASKVCIRPFNPPFLVIKAGGNTYIINDADSDITREMYNNIFGGIQ